MGASQAQATQSRAPERSRPRERVATLLADPLAPIAVLCLILVFALYARVFDLGQPCAAPCNTTADHILIFDETYYVNAARVIDGINPPASQPYHDAPKGEDPNAEHPQLAKLIMAGTIKLFGDDPRGWRIGSVIFGLIALVALYALVRAAGGGAWLAVSATAVMALDNLLLVHGRIATLDIYALAMMLIAATLYIRGSPLLAGIALGIGACMKEVALFLVFVILLFEALRVARARWVKHDVSGWVRASVAPFALFLLVTCASGLALLWLLDVLVPAHDPTTHITYSGNPFAHLAHIFHYAQQLTTRPDAIGIASTPWQWLLDQKTIPYAEVAANTITGGHVISSLPLVYFRGAINPFIIFLAIPATFAAAAAAWRQGDGVAAVGVCWCAGAFLPFVYESQISGRITYLYYMVIVMPGVYLVLTRLFADRRMPTAATVGWAVALVYGFLNLYPLRTLL